MGDFSYERKMEAQRVNQVIQDMEQRERELLFKSSNLKESVIGLRKNFWEDVTVNIENPDDIIETEVSIKQQTELLSERERVHGHLDEELKTLRRLKDSPYFARIDFKEKAALSKQQIYIGTASFMDENEEEFLIYDWRAPISSMYYDYLPGQAEDRKSTRLNSSHVAISYAVF